MMNESIYKWSFLLFLKAFCVSQACGSANQKPEEREDDKRGIVIGQTSLIFKMADGVLQAVPFHE
jgi:hypothetical protein